MFDRYNKKTFPNIGDIMKMTQIDINNNRKIIKSEIIFIRKDYTNASLDTGNVVLIHSPVGFRHQNDYHTYSSILHHEFRYVKALLVEKKDKLFTR